MNDKEIKLEKLAEKYNGHFTTRVLNDHGFSKYDISKLVENGTLERVLRGKYVYSKELNDEFALIQLNNTKIIYSNETALYLHNMTGRYPNPLTVTTIRGYHLRNKNLSIYYVKDDVFLLGVMELESFSGNKIKVYDKERTICDIIKNKKKIEEQVYVEGIQSYFKNEKPNLKKLAHYAKKLGIKDKVWDVVMLFTAP